MSTDVSFFGSAEDFKGKEASAKQLHQTPLAEYLWQTPFLYYYRFDAAAHKAILEQCYQSLWQHDPSIMQQYFFPTPQELDKALDQTVHRNKHNVSKATRTQLHGNNRITSKNLARQKGRLCGRLFRKGELVYRCRHCGVDDTCVLCSECFHATNHDGHDVLFSMSPGSGGCCDCADPEAWKVPLQCEIHTECCSSEDEKSLPSLPEDIVESIRSTVQTVLDYILDVFTLAPEDVSLPSSTDELLKSVQQTRSYINSVGIRERPTMEDENDVNMANTVQDALMLDSINEAKEEYVCIAWNDESHAFSHVLECIASATGCDYEQAKEIVDSIHAYGRAVISRSRNIDHLRKIATPLAAIHLGVTIRPARDIYREDVCVVLLKWLNELSHGQTRFFVDFEHGDDVFRRIIAQEICAKWAARLIPAGIQNEQRNGSNAALFDSMESELTPTSFIAGIAAGTTESSDVMDATMTTTTSGNQRSKCSTPVLQDVGDIDWNPAAVMRQFGAIRQEEMELTDKLLGGNREADGAISQWKKAKVSAEEIQSKFLEKVRLDYLMLYDFKFWKEIRILMRELYISTLASNKDCKRFLGERLARNYTRLAEFFLLKDREAESSIILFSVQLLTVPSVADLLVNEYDFFAVVCSALATFFLTDHLYLIPPSAKEQLNIRVNCESRAFRVRRYFNAFHDLRYMMNVDMIKPILAQDPLYLRQFLDMIALFQCMNAQICQKDTHVEYESEMWVNAFNVTLQIAKCCRQFSDCFSRLFTSSNEDRIASARILLSAISRTLLKIYEWDPSSCGMREIKDDSRQQRPNTQQPGIPGPSLQVYHTVQLSNSHQLISIVKYDITSEPVSFHHPLHWLLAGLLEQAALLDDTVLAELGCADNILQTIIRSGSPDISPSDILLSIVDFSIRTIAFSAQVRAGVWVRNGYGIRNQAHHYRDISLRENTFDADIFLLQTAFALADVDKLLLTLLDRFSLLGWFFGGEKEHPQYDASQTIFMIEELLNLLIICACDRSNCTGVSIQDKIRKEIIHNLCLGPLTYSELLKRIPERMHEHADFDSILAAVGDFRAPTGVNDFGSYTLKQHLYSEVDPYFWHYSRNSREEALATLKARWKKDNPGKPDKEFFILPKTSRIGIGPFKFVGSFLQSPIFTKMLSQVFWSARCPDSLKSVTILDQALQLVMIGLLDGNYRAGDADKGFAFQACFQANRFPNMETDATMLDLLSMLRDDDAFNEIHAQLEWIFRKLEEYDNVHTHQKMHEWKQQRQLKMQRTPSEASVSDQEAKKRAAIERQKKIMAQFAQAQSQFMEQNEDLYDEEDLEDAESKVSENLLSPVVAEGSNYEISRLYSYPVGTCIVCQEDVNQKSEPYGLLGFIQTSNILREVPDLGDKATLEEICNIYCKGLDTEWPDQHILPDEETSVPVFQTELHKIGFYSSTCGHLMHIKCFNNYCASIDSRHSSQLTRNHPEDRSRKEFMCPLCKSIGNTLLPIFWKGRKEAFPGIIAAHDTPNYYAFLQKGVQSGIDRLVNAIVHYRANAAQRRWSGGANKLKEAVATWMPTLRTSSSSTISFDSSLSSTANSSATHDFLTSFSHSHATPTAQTDHSSSSDRQLPPLRVGCGRSMGGSHMESRFGPFDTNVLYPTAVENLTLISNVYTQLFEVLSAIHEEICSYEPTRDMSTGVKNIDLLWCMLGYTIVAIEISIRGNKLPTELPERVEHTGSLFDQIPQQMQMLLRILSDTVLAYTFVMSQQDQNSSSGLSGSSTGGVGAQIATRVHLLALGRLRQVFVDAQVGDFANVQGLGYDRVVVHENPTLLQDDPFMILAELTLHGIPYAKLNVHALLRVLLLAELTKTTVALVQEQLKRIRSGELPIRQVELEECEALEDDELAAVRRLVFFVMDSLQIPDNEAVTIFDAIGQEKFRRLLRSFALPYLRRGLILMIVRYGYIPRRKAHQGQQEDEQVMMDSYVEEENEFDRLLDLLWLPNLSEIVQLEPENEHLIQGWCRHHLKESDHAMQLQEAHGVLSSPCTRLQDIPLDLPTPLRLVPLPRQLDTLIDESMKRVCDKCGTVPSDPALCLLCGTFVCAQSFCCAEDEQGECNLHRINCGGEVGIFLWVKRCVLILLHNNNGWFINAPYLDTHGEVDQGLRRGKPQYLNVKRYSEIRKLWLQHSIPNYVARQIEANYDIGGWTTL